MRIGVYMKMAPTESNYNGGLMPIPMLLGQQLNSDFMFVLCVTFHYHSSKTLYN